MKIYQALVDAFIALLVVLLLFGCAAPRTEYVPYEVKVEIAVPCTVEDPAEPEWATRDMPRVDPKTGEGIDLAVDKLIAERLQYQGYAKKLKAANAGCRRKGGTP